jgi:hypothetical protein
MTVNVQWPISSMCDGIEQRLLFGQIEIDVVCCEPEHTERFDEPSAFGEPCSFGESKHVKKQRPPRAHIRCHFGSSPAAISRTGNVISCIKGRPTIASKCPEIYAKFLKEFQTLYTTTRIIVSAFSTFYRAETLDEHETAYAMLISQTDAYMKETSDHMASFTSKEMVVHRMQQLENMKTMFSSVKESLVIPTHRRKRYKSVC